MSSPLFSAILAVCQWTTVAGPTRPELNAPPVIESLSGPAVADALKEEVTYVVVATDRDEDPLTFEWTFSNGDFFTTSEPSINYTWPAGGDYTVTVVADDLQPAHRVTSDPTATTVNDPQTRFSDGSIQGNEELDENLSFNAYVLDRFFASAQEGEQGQLFRSWDGLTWIGPLLESPALEPKEILWDGTQFVMVAMEWNDEASAMVGAVYTSPGGNLWKRAWQSEDPNQLFHSAVWDGTLFVIGMGAGHLLVSEDLLSWETVVLPDTPAKGPPGDCVEMVLLENHICVLTCNAIYKLDGGAWSFVEEFAELRKEMIALDSETIFLGGDGPQVWSTSDGATWPEENFYGAGALAVTLPGTVEEFVEIESVLWARFSPSDGSIDDQWYVRNPLTARWIRVNAMGLPDGGIAAYGAGRTVSLMGPDGLTRVSDSLYPDNTAPEGDLGGPSQVTARISSSYSVSLLDAEEDSLSHWWDLGEGLPWVQGAMADLRWSTGGARTLTHRATDMKGGVFVTEYTVNVVDPLDSWVLAENTSQAHLSELVEGAEGRLVAVGVVSTILVSDDADEWSEHAVNEDDVLLRSVAYSGTHYIAVGGKERFGKIFRSTDGETWTTAWSSAEEITELRDVIVVGESMLVVGESGLILRSTDHGASWSVVQQEVTTELLRRIAYGGGQYAISYWDGILVSNDGLTWFDGQAPGLGWNNLFWVNDRFISSGWRLSDGLWSSPDAMNWSRPVVVPQESYEMPIVVGFGDLYFAMGNYSQGPNQVAISVDGEHWFAKEAPKNWSWRQGGVIYGDSIVTVGNDGQIWRSQGVSEPNTAVVTFDIWQKDHPLNGLNGPYDDPDGDGLTNLVEFALWMKADERELVGEDGVTLNRGAHVFYNPETGKIDLEHLRPQSVERVTYRLRYTLDFVTWQEADLVPEELVLGNGSTRVCYRDLEQLTGVGLGRCFFEVAVTAERGLLGF